MFLLKWTIHKQVDFSCLQVSKLIKLTILFFFLWKGNSHYFLTYSQHTCTMLQNYPLSSLDKFTVLLVGFLPWPEQSLLPRLPLVIWYPIHFYSCFSIFKYLMVTLNIVGILFFPRATFVTFAMPYFALLLVQCKFRLYTVWICIVIIKAIFSSAIN